MAATKEYKNDYKYQAGFGNHFSSEALPDALPKGNFFQQNACIYFWRTKGAME